MIAAALGLLLLLPSALLPGDIDRAERAYRLGQFEQALALYGEVLRDETGHRGAVLHNMGNCAQRLGRAAEAALYYRRALLRLPGDAAIHHNLDLVERQLGLDSERDGAARTPIDVAPWLWCALALQSAGLVGAMFASSRAQRIAALVAVTFGLGAAGMTMALQLRQAPARIVVLSPATLRAEPVGDAAVIVSLRPGEVARMVERRGEWLRIVAGAARGWVGAAAVGVVD